jgi:hypothetical protein
VDLVQNPYVSEFTRKTLAQFGWEDNDPIPVALGDLLVQFKSDLPASSRTDVLIDASLMSPEQVQQARDMLAAAKQIRTRQDKEAEIEAATATMDPSVAALYRQLENEGPTIVDDRAETPPPAAPAAEAPPAEPEPAAEPGVVGDDPMIILPFCPRCGWDMRQRFEVDITELDKQDFLSAVLGGTRFERRFELMGGRMVLVFRSLLAEENRAIQRQLVLDQEAKVFVTTDEWLLRMMEYRLACSLDRVEAGNGRVLHQVPTLAEMPHTPPEDCPLQTALVPLLEFVNNKVLAHEVTRRLAGQHLRHFQRLVEALEAMSLEPSFWNGIG